MGTEAHFVTTIVTTILMIYDRRILLDAILVMGILVRTRR
jgi:hypothetical protein